MTHEQGIECEVCKNPQGCEDLQKIERIESMGMPVNGYLINARQYFIKCPTLRAKIDGLLSNPESKSGGIGTDTLRFRKG